MFITKIKLKNFRCFKTCEFDFDKKIVLIEGQNGSGKTSLLEALHYACYLRSFKTRQSNELVNFSSDSFFLQVDFDEIVGISNQIQVGHSNSTGKLVKFNQKLVKSFKEIVSRYQIVSIAEDDLELIKGTPEKRRAFLNQSLFLLDPDFVFKMRGYRQVLDQRKSFIIKNGIFSPKLERELYIWTKMLWEKSISIQKLSVNFLSRAQGRLNELLHKYFPDLKQIRIDLKYLPKNLKLDLKFDLFWENYKANLLEKEFKWGRNLFGVQLDDFLIFFKSKRAKFFASRGEQKLVLLLLKVVQFLNVQKKTGEIGCLLLDDFLTDLDSKRLNGVLKLLNDLNCQTILTCPLKSIIFSKVTNFSDYQLIEL